MDVSDLLDPLNDAQRDAVTAPPGPVLVVAGAGSGKTRVLVLRIAWLIRVEGASPYGVLAVTFTNKAAAEMRGRIEQLLGIPDGGMWVGTIHILAHNRQRFQHILEDEFQDTIGLQYAWLRLLAGERANLFAVGVDDQSIYGWRGARIENIQRYSMDFPGTRILRLEENYRSTRTILAAAKALLAHKNNQHGKELWTRGEQGA